jgi:acyl-CoA synthetase (AMP-forming)/AMP-acid ligase II
LEFTERTGCPVYEVWGMTELAGATSANPVYGLNKPGTIGLPYPGNAFRVVDVDDAAKEMPRGERGELMYRGPLVMQGYYNNPQATAETIRPDGWLHIGDIATIDEAKGELPKPTSSSSQELRCRAQTLWRIVASILRHTKCLAQCSLSRRYPPRRRARSCGGC